MKQTELVVRNDKTTGFVSKIVGSAGLLALSMSPAFALEISAIQTEVDSIPALVGAVAAGVVLIALTIKGFKWARSAFS